MPLLLYRDMRAEGERGDASRTSRGHPLDTDGGGVLWHADMLPGVILLDAQVQAHDRPKQDTALARGVAGCEAYRVLPRGRGRDGVIGMFPGPRRDARARARSKADATQGARARVTRARKAGRKCV